MPLYPLPENDEKEMLNIAFRVLEWIRDSRFKILLRWHKLQWVGIVDDINYPRYDEQYGRSLSYVRGWVTNGSHSRFSYSVKEFFEPRFRKIPGSGELKDTIGAFPMSDLFVFTARNTPTSSDDNDSDFTYVADGRTSERINAYEQHMGIMQTANAELGNDVLKYKRMVADAESRASSAFHSLESAKDELARLREANIRISEQNAELERINKLLTIESATEAARIDKKMENAVAEGDLKGSTELQQLSKKADDLDEFLRKILHFYPRQGNMNEANTEILRKVGGMLAGMQDQMKDLDGKVNDLNKKQKASDKEEG